MAILILLIVGSLVWWSVARSSLRDAEAVERLGQVKSVSMKLTANVQSSHDDNLNIEVESQTELSVEDALSKSQDQLRALGTDKKLDYYIAYDGNDRLAYFLEDSEIVKKNSQTDDINDFRSALVILSSGSLVKDDKLGDCLELDAEVAQRLIACLLGMYVDTTANITSEKILAPIKIDSKKREVVSIDLDLAQGVGSEVDLGSKINIKLELSDYNKDFGLKVPDKKEVQ